MKDKAQKKVGVPFSTSRKMEKAVKHRTQKVRRAMGKNEIRKENY
jgi:hypothetical protein